jgi:metal-responsive CopG/Arc/MetJ family transcriptional regulator
MTAGMKVAVSIPDDVFDEADRLARASGESRSAFYSRALNAYVQSHAPDRITAALDLVVGEVDDVSSDFAKRAARRTIERNRW